MANDDPYLRGLQRRMAHNRAAEAAAKADLDTHVLNSDEDGIGESEQQIADVRAQQKNLASLAQEYIARQNPPECVKSCGDGSGESDPCSAKIKETLQSR
jgi:hypothetical protein